MNNIYCKDEEKTEKLGHLLGTLLSDGDVTKIGADIGAGINYDLNNEWSLKAELKYQVIKNWDELYLSVGASYHF